LLIQIPCYNCGMVVKKLLRRITYVVITLLVATVSVLSFAGRENQQQDGFETIHKPVLVTDWELADKTIVRQNQTIAIHRTFSASEFADYREPVIFFRTQNLIVYAAVDGVEFYHSRKPSSSLIGNETGNDVHFINLPQADGQDHDIYLEFYSSFQPPESLMWHYKDQERNIITPEIWFGPKAQCNNRYLDLCFWPAVVSCLVIGAGILALITILVVFLTKKLYLRSHYYFAVLCIVCGVAFLIESSVLDPFVSDSFYLFFLSTFAIAVVPEVFCLFLSESKFLPYNYKINRFFSVLSCVNAILVCIFAFIDVIPFTFIRYCVICFNIVFLVLNISITLGETVSFNQRLKFAVITMTISASAMIVDQIFVLAPPGHLDAYRFTRPCFFLFIISLAYELLNNFFNDEVLSARKKVYEDVVYSDQLTGTRSRHSFLQVGKNVIAAGNGEIVLTLCEVVNLKQINAKYGFDNGDLCLKMFAEELKNRFGERNVFRFDGTGFAILTRNMHYDDVCSKMNVLKSFLAGNNKFSFGSEVIINYSTKAYVNDSNEEFGHFVSRTNQILSSENPEKCR